MPRLAANDGDLLDEVESHLAALASLLQQPNAVNLAAAREQYELADSVFCDAANLGDPRWKAVRRNCHEASHAWDVACRNPAVRTELIALLTPDPDSNTEPTLWAVNGAEADYLGGVALRAFAPSTAWPARSYAGAGRLLCLWTPHWVLPALTDRHWIDARSTVAFPASHADAEVAASLWDPYNDDSTYHDLYDAVDAARAILAT